MTARQVENTPRPIEDLERVVAWSKECLVRESAMKKPSFVFKGSV